MNGQMNHFSEEAQRENGTAIFKNLPIGPIAGLVCVWLFSGGITQIKQPKRQGQIDE